MKFYVVVVVVDVDDSVYSGDSARSREFMLSFSAKSNAWWNWWNEGGARSLTFPRMRPSRIGSRDVNREGSTDRLGLIAKVKTKKQIAATIRGSRQFFYVFKLRSRTA